MGSKEYSDEYVYLDDITKWWKDIYYAAIFWRKSAFKGCKELTKKVSNVMNPFLKKKGIKGKIGFNCCIDKEWLIEEYTEETVKRFHICEIGVDIEVKMSVVVAMVDILNKVVEELDPDYVLYKNWALWGPEDDEPIPEKVKDNEKLSYIISTMIYSAIRKDRIDKKLLEEYKIFEEVCKMYETENHYIFVDRAALELKKYGKTDIWTWGLPMKRQKTRKGKGSNKRGKRTRRNA